MDPIFAVLLTVTVANLILGGFVLWNKPRAEVNRVFTLMAVSAGGWALTNALFQVTDSVRWALLWARLSYLCAIVLAASFLHFAWVFPVPKDTALRYKFPLWLVALAIGLLPWGAGVVITSVDIGVKRTIHTSSGIYAIAGFMVITTFLAFGTFAWYHGSLRRVTREQSRYVLTGSFLSATIGLLCNLFLPLQGNYTYVWLGPVALLFFVGFSMYAIVTQHLFDIRILISKTLLYSLLLAAVGAGYSVVEHALTEFLQHAFQSLRYAWLANIGGALVAAVFFAPLKKWLEERIGRLIRKHSGEQKR